MSQTWECFKCNNPYTEKEEDKTTNEFDAYLRHCGLCGEDCLQKFSKDEKMKLSIKFLLEGEGMKLKHNGVNVV